MDEGRAVDYQELLQDLNERLRELQFRRRAFGDDPFNRWEEAAIRKQIAAIRTEMFYSSHPDLRRHRYLVEAMAQGVLVIFFLIAIDWANMAIRKIGVESAEVSYSIFTVVTSAVLLYFLARSFSNMREKNRQETIRQVISGDLELFLKIDQMVSQLTKGQI